MDQQRNQSTGTSGTQQQPTTGQNLPDDTGKTQTTGNDLTEQAGNESGTGQMQNTGTENWQEDDDKSA